MTNAVPFGWYSEFGLPFSSVIAVLTISARNSPDAGTIRFGMSPACRPSAAIMPCFLAVGLKCPPAEVNGGSHLPTAWTWKACSPGAMPLSASRSSTPCGPSLSAMVPTPAPLALFSVTVAVSAIAGAARARAAAIGRSMRAIIVVSGVGVSATDDSAGVLFRAVPCLVPLRDGVRRIAVCCQRCEAGL
jgi:hypothetical protein